jgi:tetratricopeptide (TPR) repeat protein
MKKALLATIVALVVSAAVFADPVASYGRGKAAQDREDWYGAIEGYQEALRENPNYNAAYQGLAESFYALGEYDQALDQTVKAEAFRKNDPSLLDLRGFIMIGLGKLDEASDLFTRVLAAWPNDVDARFGLAEIDISNGKNSAASGEYLDALKRNPENRKALLSLALMAEESGNAAMARDYVSKALMYHGDNPQVFYFAAYIASRDGRAGEAENRVRAALSLRGDYDDARELLASILYGQARYQEVIDICDARIASSRDHASAWYLRTLALEKLGKYEDALKSAKAALQVASEDELLRSMLESIVMERLPFEDARRSSWAAWHVAKAAQFEEKNMSEQALYEYRRALKINPYDVSSRQSYAKVLLNRGYPQGYVSQLKFVQGIGKSTNAINDAIESYGKLLSSSVANVWGVDPLYLEKDHTSIGLYYLKDGANVIHPDAERITTTMLSDVFSHDPRFSVTARETAVGSYSEAFRASREAGEDYFALVGFRENERDLQIIADLYVSRTGSRAETFNVFRTGNNRYSNALRRLAQSIAAAMPARGAIVKRYQADAVIDLGKSDGVKAGDAFEIYPDSAVTVKNEGIGVVRNESALLGVFTVKTVDEEISLGTIERNGFYDRINAKDVALPKPKSADGTASTAGASGAASTSATATAGSSSANEPKEAKRAPALLSLLRKIR